MRINFFKLKLSYKINKLGLELAKFVGYEVKELKP